jgi:hypothetical protein
MLFHEGRQQVLARRVRGMRAVGLGGRNRARPLAEQACGQAIAQLVPRARERVDLVEQQDLIAVVEHRRVAIGHARLERMLVPMIPLAEDAVELRSDDVDRAAPQIAP